MLGLTLLVVSIGIADSINPSTILPAMFLASRPNGRGAGAFTTGVFIVYLAGGLVLVLGPGPALIGALRDAGPRFEHVTETGAGAVLLALAVVMLRSRGRRPRQREATDRMQTSRFAFVIGAGISAIELPTAFLYFGAVSAIINATTSLTARVALVVVYNVLFVLPLVLILGLRLVAGAQADRRLAAAATWLRTAAPVALATVSSLAGAVLVSAGVSGLIVAT
jgi:threonine/homoserine/homoserine lactone efflux protein